MAFLLNPQWLAQAPGAPRGLNWWDQNRFNMSDLQGPQTAAPSPQAAAAAPAPLAPQVNEQDMAAQRAVQQFASGGGEGSGGNPSGPGGSGQQERDPNAGHDSWGRMLGIGGMLGGIFAGGAPVGMLAGAAGTGIDQRNANSRLSAYANEMGVSPVSLGMRDFSRAMTSNSIPGILGNLGVSTNRAALNGMIDTAFRGRPDIFASGASAAPGGGASDPFSAYGFGADPFGAGMAQSTYSPGWGPNDAFAPGDNAFANPSTPTPAAYDQAGAGYSAPADPSTQGALGAAFGQDWGWAKGGKVRGPGLLPGVDPPGSDNIVGGLQTGEGVITKAAMKRYGPGLLNAINSGKIDPKMVRGLLSR